MNIFKSARTKLTLYYLAIIMTISLFFSVIIYKGATFELTRIENMQRSRRPNPQFLIDPEIIRETKSRISFTLFVLNAIILGVSGFSGYFLSGKTLKPIADMMEEQKDFVSNASHELRTPLAALKSQIEVALRAKKVTISEAKDLLKSNLEDVNNMAKLSNYLLKLNKFQIGNDKIKFKKIDLAEIVEIQIKGYKKSITKFDIKTNLEKALINGNEDSLSELVSILIDNAIKYGEGKTIEVITRKNGVLIVKDNGLGISEDDQKRIFDRFYRGDKARTKDGYGLGLSIAKQIADIHNAKIKVVSKIGSGSTFKVIFS